jgi:release factor glutamine methyltransferase
MTDMTIVASTTIAQLLADAVTGLVAVSNSSARLDAEVLLAHAMKQSRRFFYAHPEFEPDTATVMAFKKLIAQRVDGVPVAHLTGSREFWSLPLKVTADTLIPRADTECLVERVLELIADKKTITLLDLGTGTGAIALALASERPAWKITGVDIIPQAVSLAQENAQRLQLSNVQFLQSDWFAALEKLSPPKRFDVIVSNPPYIAPDDEHLQQGDLRFEPHSALVAADNGLADLEKIIAGAKNFLTDDGYLFLEHGWQQAAAVRALLIQYSFVGINTWQDYGGNDRVTVGRLSGNNFS